MPQQAYSLLVAGPWLAWLIYWKVSAAGTKATRRAESALSRAAHLVPLALAFLLLSMPRVPGPALLSRTVFAHWLLAYWVGIAVLVTGLLFSVWARMHLGRNWSATVTLKEGHELIRTGPYRLVRHPIYTGILTGLIGTALCRNEWRGLVAIVLAFAAFSYKLRLEERWMVETFGAAYLRYRQQVPALIPWVG